MAVAGKKKRGADNYLTDRNWDNDDDDAEEAGVFKEASEDILNTRKVIKAKRRNIGDSEQSTKTTNAFSGFGGFGVKKETSTPFANAGFNGFNIKNSSAAPAANGSFTGGSFPKSALTANNNESSFNKSTISQGFWKTSDENEDFFANRGNKENEGKNKDTETKENTEQNNNLNGSSSNESYLKELTALNLSVLAWIKKHVDSNPCVDLTPVFKDYEKHIKQLEQSSNDKKLESNDTGITPPTNILKPGDISGVSPALLSGKSNILSSSTPIIQKDNIVPAISGQGLFAGLNAKPPQSGTQITEKQSSTVTTENNNPEEGPAIPDRKTIVENDAFHQIRCKLFFKKSEEFQELGIGMLYLKPSGEDVQLLIRMENATGKVLLNIKVTTSMPMSRKGKNNVMIVSVPNPPVFSKPEHGDNSVPCTYLIRVKGADDADLLLEKMQSR